MKKVFVLFALAVFTISGIRDKSLGMGDGGTELMSSPPDFSLAFVPSSERERLVHLYSVTSEIVKGVTVTDVSVKQVGLANLSDRNVVGIRLGWQIRNDEAPSVTLLEGQSRLLHFRFAVGKRLLITYPVLSLSDIAEPLKRRGHLNGMIAVEVSVDEILFEDGSTWSRRASQVSSIQDPFGGHRVRRAALSLGTKSTTLALQDEGVIIEEGGEPAAKTLNKACAIVPRLGPGWHCIAFNGANCKISGSNCSD